jgi:hypothetical protein
MFLATQCLRYSVNRLGRMWQNPLPDFCPRGAVRFSLAECKRERNRERVNAGLQRPKAEGKHLGRRLRAFDPAWAVALYQETHSWRKVSRVMQVPLSTLHRRMAAKPPLQNAPEDLRDGF